MTVGSTSGGGRRRPAQQLRRRPVALHPRLGVQTGVDKDALAVRLDQVDRHRNADSHIERVAQAPHAGRRAEVPDDETGDAGHQISRPAVCQ
ncbi:hypothetical protein ACX9NE_24900 [Mycobacterium sp. ML4]